MKLPVTNTNFEKVVRGASKFSSYIKFENKEVTGELYRSEFLPLDCLKDLVIDIEDHYVGDRNTQAPAVFVEGDYEIYVQVRVIFNTLALENEKEAVL